MDDRGHPAYYGPPPNMNMPPPPPPSEPARKIRKQSPQSAVHIFWQNFKTSHSGKVFSVLPSNPHARQKRHQRPSYTGKRVAKSYDAARAECNRDVDRIIKECRRTNQKYRDLHFDIEWDLKSHQRDCLDGLRKSHKEMRPKGVKRVTDIFEKPEFYINGPTAGDVRQGRDGDCFLMAALCGLGNMEGLIDRVCVKHDLQVGVYGFVFHRDGEWQQTIIDDKLYLKAPDYDEALDERAVWDNINRIDSGEEYRKAHQTGSRALYFAQCSEENETWLPLLEKAYAKAHGDYSAIDGGFTGEAVEDLTGGVTTEIYSTDILDKEAFWTDELMHVNKDFLFGCATGFYSNWLDTKGQNQDRSRQGIDEGHAYSIMEAREVKGKRLLKLRNPWGSSEWTGSWSDGSAEWDGEWMELLNHRFGNDGVFWISYEDLLKKYQHFDRTRIFDKEWSVSQAWLGVDVGWSPEYHSTRFQLTVKEKGPVVIVLSQLDDTYFDGLQGCYAFDLQFRLEEGEEGDPNDYVVRSNGAYAMARSVSTDIELEAGTYVVLMKITATRQINDPPVEDLLAKYAEERRNKFIQIGLSYDLAHAKGVYVESRAEKMERKRKEEQRKQEQKARIKTKTRERAEKHWRKQKMTHDREKARRAKKKNKGDGIGNFVERSRQGSGSLDAQPGTAMGGPPGEERTNGASQDREGDASHQNLPMRIKSFSGETIDIEGPPKEACSPSVPPPTREMTMDGDALSTLNVGAEGIVQSLNAVVQAAEDETMASKADLRPILTDDLTTETEEQPQTPIIQVNGKDAVTDVKPLPNLPPLSRPEHTLPTQSLRMNGAEARTTPAPYRHNAFDPQRQDTVNPQQQDIFGPRRQDTFGSQLQDNFGSTTANGFRTPANMRNDLNETGSMDSFPSFDWNSELDMSSLYDSTSSSSFDPDTDLEDGPEQGLFRIDPGDPHRPTSSHSFSTTSSDGSILYKPPIVPFHRRRYHFRDPRRPLPHHPDRQSQPEKEEVGEEPWNAVCVVGLRVYSKAGGKEALELKVVWGEKEEDERRKRKRARKNKKRRTKGQRDMEVIVKEGEDVLEVMSPHIKLDPDDQGKGAMSTSLGVGHGDTSGVGEA